MNLICKFKPEESSCLDCMLLCFAHWQCKRSDRPLGRLTSQSTLWLQPRWALCITLMLHRYWFCRLTCWLGTHTAAGGLCHPMPHSDAVAVVGSHSTCASHGTQTPCSCVLDNVTSICHAGFVLILSPRGEANAVQSCFHCQTVYGFSCVSVQREELFSQQRQQAEGVAGHSCAGGAQPFPRASSTEIFANNNNYNTKEKEREQSSDLCSQIPAMHSKAAWPLLLSRCRGGPWGSPTLRGS